MPSNLVKQLKQVSLFADLGREDIQAVARLVKREECRAGSTISQQGQIGLTAYLIESGELRVLHVDPQGAEREVGRLGPGEFLGETSLLLGEPRDATVEVVRDATLLYLNKRDFDQLLDERPSVLEAMQMRPDVARRRQARRFKWQEPDEVVITCSHKHNAVLGRNLALPIFVLLAITIGCWYLRSQPVLMMVVGGLSVFPLLFSIYLIINHQNDNYIVTSRRVVHEERVPLIREARAEAPLRTVQDIQQTQEGLLAHLFNFGNLIIETAGERGHVVFRQIPDPGETRDAIFEQMTRVRAGARAEERAAIRASLGRQFGIQAPVEQPAPPEPTTERRRFKLAVPKWLRALSRSLSFFLPPLRYEEGDTITWRKHWIALIRPTALPALGVAIATAAALALLYLDLFEWSSVLAVYGLVLCLLLPWWMWRFDDWQNDVYQVTTTRIIDVERMPFYLREDRREASLANIQNINLTIPGITGKLLNYGSVTIETAGAGAFTFEHVKDPRGVQAEISGRMNAFQRRQSQEAAERHRTELLEWFTVYDQFRDSASPATEQPSPE